MVSEESKVATRRFELASKASAPTVTKQSTTKPISFNKQFTEPVKSAGEPARAGSAKSSPLKQNLVAVAPISPVKVRPSTVKVTSPVKATSPVKVASAVKTADREARSRPVEAKAADAIDDDRETVMVGCVASRSKLFSQSTSSDAAKISSGTNAPSSGVKAQWRKSSADATPPLRDEKPADRVDKSKRLSAHGYPLETSAKVVAPSKRFSTVEQSGADDSHGSQQQTTPPWVAMARRKQPDDKPEVKSDAKTDVKDVRAADAKKGVVKTTDAKITAKMADVKKTDNKTSDVQPKAQKKDAAEEKNVTSEMKSLFEKDTKSQPSSVPAWKQQRAKKEEPKPEPEDNLPAWKRHLNENRDKVNVGGKGVSAAPTGLGAKTMTILDRKPETKKTEVRDT